MADAFPAEAAGYAHPDYQRSLAAWGVPRPLPGSGGWLLVRRIPGEVALDALAGYPRLQCHDWARLPDDLDDQGDLVSVVGVTDALAEVAPETLRAAFPAGLWPYKDHAVVDLAAPAVSAAHRSRVRRVARVVRVEIDADPGRHLETWERLYAALRERHQLTGIKALSREAFALQLGVPGCVAFRALTKDGDVSMLLWYIQGSVATYHLGASSPEGYAASASYALFDAAFAAFRDRGVRWLDLGANAGAEPSPTDGLARFKRGWTPLTRPTWLGARIGRPDLYATLVASHGAQPFMPAYRRPHDG
jgi:hypothetical protein